MRHSFKIVNGDTDSIMICKQDGSIFPEEEQSSLLKEINGLLPPFIKFKNDGIFTRVICLKTKNYITVDSKGKIKIRGSALKSATLEPILKQFLKEMLNALIEDKKHILIDIYEKYANMIDDIKDIVPWAKKQSLSKVTFDGTRKNETNVLDAIKGKEYGPGDKVYLITSAKMEPTGEVYKVGKKKGQPKLKKVKYLTLLEDYKGDYDKNTYYEKLWKCIKRFETVLPIKEMFKQRNEEINNET